MTGPTGRVTGGGISSLRRIAAPKPPPEQQTERCEFCAADIGERHGHIADLVDHRLLCVCRPCYLLFAPRGAGGGRYRGVGEEVRRVADLVLDDARWDSLRIPVDLVFFFRQSGADHLLAFYPGPGGATESELDLATWDEISSANPVLDDLEPDVEAVLLRRHDDVVRLLPGAHRRLLRARRRGAQPVDGLGGGAEVWREIDAFFAALDDRSTVVPRDTAPRPGEMSGT